MEEREGSLASRTGPPGGLQPGGGEGGNGTSQTPCVP